ncbi:MAG: hypothetical protein FJZ97_11100 [Chloroflexi bacterium]|nr:hypothetical protein [Chloroflexota bacterium]
MSTLNQYSFLWVAIGGAGVVALVLTLRRAPARQWLALAGVVLGLAAAYAVVRPTPGASNAEAELQASIGSGTPVLIELQSPY